MTNENNYQALKKSYEIKEKSALENRLKIEQVAEQRLMLLQQIQKEELTIREKLKETAERIKKSALENIGIDKVNSLNSYQKRLLSELALLEKDMSEKKHEFEQAQIRCQIANKDWQDARIEVKKIEKLIESQELSINELKNILEESATEDMSISRRWKK